MIPFLDILTNPDRVTRKDQVAFWGKSTANFAIYLLLFVGEICTFPKTLTSHNSLQKQDDEVDNKTAYKNWERKESMRERKIEKNWLKRSKVWLMLMRENKKAA